jgi:hypothetical protein
LQGGRGDHDPATSLADSLWRLREQQSTCLGQEDDFSVRDMAKITPALSSTGQRMGSLLLAIAPVSLVVGGAGTMRIMSWRPVGQVRRRFMVATRPPTDKDVADALAAMAQQGG